MNLSANRTVRELATELPNATRVFEKLGIDYCCGGSKSLIAACLQARIPVETVLQALEQGGGVKQTPGSTTPDLGSATLTDLIEHILTVHHAYVKQELPRISQLLHKVVSVHGKNRPELGQIQKAFQGMAEELNSHLLKEEHILFPYIVALESAVENDKPKPIPAFGTVGNPVHMMEMEHDSAGDALKEISKLSSNHTPPDDACFSYRTLYTVLKEFETDLHQHIHLENNILFPRAIELESAVEVSR
jgi:regulator of cell morphogenesis and NO signaling